MATNNEPVLKIENVFCEPCLREKIQVRPTHFCLECEDTLCADCKRTHQKIRATLSHNVSELRASPDANDDVVQQQDSKLVSFTQKCEKHNLKKFKYMCTSHNTVCCSKCVINDHRKCENVVPLLEHVQTREFAKELSSITDAIEYLKYNAERLNEHGKMRISFEENACNDFQSKLKLFKTEIEQTLAKLLKKSDKTCQSMSSGNRNEANVEVERTNAMLLGLESSEHLLDEIVDTNNQNLAYERILAVQNIKDQCSGYETELKQKLSNITSRQSLEWTIDIHNATKALSESVKLDSVKTQDQTLLYKSYPYKTPAFSKTIGVTQMSSSICIKDCVSLEYGKFVVSDWKNKLLRVFDIKEGRELKSVNLDSEPWGIVNANPNDIRVTLPNTKQLCDLSFQNGTMKIKRYISTNEEVLGIIRSRYWRQFTICTRIGAIGTIGDDGKISEPVKSFNRTFISNFTSAVHCIATNSTGDVIYLSRAKANCVDAYDLSGGFKFEYKHKELIAPLGLMVGKHDEIFICSYGTSQIHVVSPQGVFIKRLLSYMDGLRGPLCLAFDRGYENLVVCDHDKGFEIKVFDYKH